MNEGAEGAGIPAVRVLPTRTGYDLWAQVYDEEDNPLIALEEAHVDRLLGDVKGKRILDVGCGTGRHAARLAQRGAEVTGVDFSGGMLARAREKAGMTGVALVEHDLSERLPFEPGCFDCVACCLVLDHVGFVSELFSEMQRVCACGGRVVVSAMHPAMNLLGVQARFRDPTTGVEMRPESVENCVSDYVMGAVRAGLVIEEIAEHVVDGDLCARSERARKYEGWPLLVTMGLLKK